MWNRREFAKASLLGLTASGSGAATPPAGTVSFRIGVAHWLSDARFDALLDFFAAQPGAVDELAFFTSETHPPLPLDEMQRRAERLAKILPRVRQRGMAAGINVLSTMGHHEENLPNSLQAPWRRVVDTHGRVSAGSFCPAQPELIEYARKIYTWMAQAAPDFIWVDDDVRLQGHKPSDFTCFCDLCVARFSAQAGRQFTRETLVQAFAAGSLDDRLALRRAWLEYNRGVIDTLLRNIEEAAHAVKPALPLGFMTGDRFYEGYDFRRWAATLGGPAKVPVRWRPGGGFYSDESLLGLVDKAHAMGRQVAALPDGAMIIQSELENFPYQRLRKSVQTTVAESVAYMAAGTTGTAFNVLSMRGDPLDEYAPLYRRIAQYRPFYQRLNAELGRSRAMGVWPAWNREQFSTANVDEAWLDRPNMALSEPYVLGEIGIPLCYDPRGATATALTGDAVHAFTRERLREIFAGGVLMDVAAWQALKRLGLEEWTGVTDVAGVDVDASEVLAPHALNAPFGGWSRDCRQSFWAKRAWRLTPAAGAETLARMVDYGARDLGPCMTAFTNAAGGRVVVMGYYPWSQIHSFAKSSQLKAVCAWLSRGRLPVVAETFSKVVLWCRQQADGRNALVVLNASLDRAERVALRLATDSREFSLVQPDAAPRHVLAEALAPGQVRLVLEGLDAWSTHLIVNRSL
jgi:hypothetical protein